MDIDDVLDLILLIAKELPNPVMGNTDCDTCNNVNLSYTIDILRTINKQYLITRRRDN